MISLWFKTRKYLNIAFVGFKPCFLLPQGVNWNYQQMNEWNECSQQVRVVTSVLWCRWVQLNWTAANMQWIATEGGWAAGPREGRKGGVMELLIQTNRDESSSSAIQTHTRISRYSGSIAHDRCGAAEKSTTIFTSSASQLGRTNIWFYRNNAAIAALISAL